MLTVSLCHIDWRHELTAPQSPPLTSGTLPCRFHLTEQRLHYCGANLKTAQDVVQLSVAWDRFSLLHLHHGFFPLEHVRLNAVHGAFQLRRSLVCLKSLLPLLSWRCRLADHGSVESVQQHRRGEIDSYGPTGGCLPRRLFRYLRCEQMCYPTEQLVPSGNSLALVVICHVVSVHEQ